MVSEMEAAGARVVLMNLDRSAGLWHLLKKLRSSFTKERPDIVHVQYLAPGLVPILAARLAMVPTVFATVHQPGRTYGWKAKSMLQTAARLCTAFFCNSLTVEKSWFGDGELFDPQQGRRRRHATIYNAVDAERIACIAENADRKALREELGVGGGPVVGMVARLRWEKGQKVLLEAMVKVVCQVPGSVLLMVGDGPEREDLQRLAGELGIAGNVRWLGQKSTDEVFRLYSIMDVVAVPSLFEGFGLTAAEAMAAARPVVASAVDGLTEVVVNGETGILVPANNAAELAASLISLLTSREKARKMGRKGQERVASHFSVQKFSELTLAAYSTYSVSI